MQPLTAAMSAQDISEVEPENALAVMPLICEDMDLEQQQVGSSLHVHRLLITVQYIRYMERALYCGIL